MNLYILLLLHIDGYICMHILYIDIDLDSQLQLQIKRGRNEDREFGGRIRRVWETGNDQYR